MSDDASTPLGPAYALGRLERALRTVATHGDPDARRRAQAKVDRWTAVLRGMADGTLTVGSRTPVADTPAWVTLEVAHGGFATGAYLAEGPLLEHEELMLLELPADVPGSTDRERLNLWFLGDAGQATLVEAVEQGRLRIDVPEEGALPVVAWLLREGLEAQALELVDALRPLMHRLRFYPRLDPVPKPAGSLVRLSSVGEVASGLRSTTTPRGIEAMNEALGVWNPLLDRLVALWLETVEGDSPDLAREPGGALRRREDGQPVVSGGWPCRLFPTDWAERRDAWLADYAAARERHRHCRKHLHPRSNFGRLRRALERCPVDSRALDGREVAGIRRALAGTIGKHGAPGSASRQTLRRKQAATLARPTHVAIAGVVLERLRPLPDDGGLPSMSLATASVRDGESPRVPAGTEVPACFVRKLRRALEAPIEELVDLGVIGSAEVLAIVLPQITARVAAAGIVDPSLAGLFEQIYAAFRRRRSLLLLDLEHQVRLDELPWVAALAPLRSDELDTRDRARRTLEQVSVLALSGFPQTILPNPLVREMGALVERAGLSLPLVEEVAADIFMGTFTRKWPRAAAIASEHLAGTLYARYYDLPPPEAYTEGPIARTKKKWGRDTADGFAQLCKNRAAEAGTGGRSFVARNGAILEQSQILTTHDLAVLVFGLDVVDRLAPMAAELASRALRFVVRRQTQSIGTFRARLQMVKNTAYAWRQAIFFLSLTDEATQRRIVGELSQLAAATDAAWASRFAPALRGLTMVLDGGRFEADGRGRDDRAARRYLGWGVGGHWLLGADQ